MSVKVAALGSAATGERPRATLAARPATHRAFGSTIPRSSSFSGFASARTARPQRSTVGGESLGADIAPSPGGRQPRRSLQLSSPTHREAATSSRSAPGRPSTAGRKGSGKGGRGRGVAGAKGRGAGHGGIDEPMDSRGPDVSSDGGLSDWQVSSQLLQQEPHQPLMLTTNAAARTPPSAVLTPPSSRRHSLSSSVPVTGPELRATGSSAPSHGGQWEVPQNQNLVSEPCDLSSLGAASPLMQHPQVDASWGSLAQGFSTEPNSAGARSGAPAKAVDVKGHLSYPNAAVAMWVACDAKQRANMPASGQSDAAALPEAPATPRLGRSPSPQPNGDDLNARKPRGVKMFRNLPVAQSLVDQVVFGRDFDAHADLDAYDGLAGLSAWERRPTGLRHSEPSKAHIPEILFRGDWGERTGAEQREARGRAPAVPINQDLTRAGYRNFQPEKRRGLKEVSLKAQNSNLPAPSLQTNVGLVVQGKEGKGKSHDSLVDDVERSIRATRRRNFHGSPLREPSLSWTEQDDPGNGRAALFPDAAGVRGVPSKGAKGIRTEVIDVAHQQPSIRREHKSHGLAGEDDDGRTSARRQKSTPSHTSRAQSSTMEEVVFKQGIHGPAKDLRFQSQGEPDWQRKPIRGVRAYPGSSAHMSYSTAMKRDSQVQPHSSAVYDSLFEDSAGKASMRVRDHAFIDTGARRLISRSVSQPTFDSSAVAKAIFGGPG